MFGLGTSSPVAEYKATGDIERVYHEIRQTLRVSGVNLNFRTWAGHQELLPLLWDAMRPNAETRAFEGAADRLRTEAARIAEALGRLDAVSRAALGESQAYQVRAALELYHYINPKLLLLTAAVRLALKGEFSNPAAQVDVPVEQIVPGIPTRMYAMEMEDEEPADERLQAIFDDIQETLSLASINSDYRTLALWPDYLAAAWAHLKPVVQRREYNEAVSRLRELARTLAAELPLPVPLTRDKLDRAGADFDRAIESTESFERLLPGLIVNVALRLQDWRTGGQLARSPFPAVSRFAGTGNEPQPEGAS